MVYEDYYEIIYMNGDGYVKRHTAVNTNAADYLLIETIAKEKADKGDRVEILPEIHQKEVALRAVFLKNVKENKNPDLRINGQYVEVKEPLVPYGKNSIGNIINLSAEQANSVIVNIMDDNVSEFKLYRIANGKLKQIRSLQSIEFRHRDRYLSFSKRTGG